MAKRQKIDWLNHSLEFAVVIIGILIAFQLNTCSEEKKEQVLIDRHVANIIDETKFNQSNIRASLKASESLKNNIDSLIVAIQRQEETAKLNALSLEALQLNTSYYKQNAYNTMIQSGDVRHFDNYQLRDDIILLYEYYSWAQGIDQAALDTYTNYYFPFAIEHLDLVEGSPPEKEVFVKKGFKNVLASYSYMMQFRIDKYKELIEKTTYFLETYDPEAASENNSE